MKTDCFYVYKGRPVAIEQIITAPYTLPKAEIRHIQRGHMLDKREVVPCDTLTELTQELANKLISEFNMRIHAFNECLRYM